METTDSTSLTSAQLETGLVHGLIDRSALETLLINNIHENENIDTLVNFFLEYLPGNRTMQDFIEQSEHTEHIEY
jgi:hypothetical protein